MLTPQRNESMMEYWISFWPAAPLFGVRWRFEKMAASPSFFQPMSVFSQMAQASAREAQNAAETGARAAAKVAPEPVKQLVEDAIEVAPRLDDVTPTQPQMLYAERPEDADKLTEIKGVGPKLEAMLNRMGVYRFDQIAGFRQSEIAWLDSQLESFRGRALRDDWVAQAKKLIS